jgi:hypothetical protein
MNKVYVAKIGTGKLFEKAKEDTIIDFSEIESKSVIKTLIFMLIRICGKDIVKNIVNIENRLETLYLLSKRQKVA